MPSKYQPKDYVQKKDFADFWFIVAIFVAVIFALYSTFKDAAGRERWSFAASVAWLAVFVIYTAFYFFIVDIIYVKVFQQPLKYNDFLDKMFNRKAAIVAYFFLVYLFIRYVGPIIVSSRT